MQIAVVGQLSRDVIAGGEPRIGGAPWHAGRALRALGADARIVCKCGEEDAVSFARELETLDLPFDLVVGAKTTAFSFSYDDHGARTMAVDAVGDAWNAEELRIDGVDWLQVAPLLRGQIDLAALAAPGRHILLDAQGIVRVAEVGPLRRDDGFDHDALRHVSMLKLSEEEAAIVGDVDVPEVIVTHGRRGAAVNGDFVPALPVDGDPTGAGDGFCVAYVASRSLGFAPAAAARRATAVVASMLAGAG